MNNIIVDARGLSCPEPVLMTQKALLQYPQAAFTVAVSSPTALDNVENLLASKGRTFKQTENDEGWEISVEAV